MASCVLACQSTTAVDPLAASQLVANLCRGDHNLADSVYRRVQLLVASFVIISIINFTKPQRRKPTRQGSVQIVQCMCLHLATLPGGVMA